jgi:hypothetical protein
VAQAIADIAEQRKALGIISSVAVVGGSSATKAAGGIGSSARAGAGDSDTESDAEVATMPRAETDAVMADAASAPFDEDGPNWPSAADEAAFIGEGNGAGQGRAVPKAGGVQTLRQEAEQAEAALGPLPSLDALIARIPAEARETLEDLFRPKFTGVKRVSKDVLK